MAADTKIIGGIIGMYFLGNLMFIPALLDPRLMSVVLQHYGGINGLVSIAVMVNILVSCLIFLAKRMGQSSRQELDK